MTWEAWTAGVATGVLLALISFSHGRYLSWFSWAKVAFIWRFVVFLAAGGASGALGVSLVGAGLTDLLPEAIDVADDVAPWFVGVAAGAAGHSLLRAEWGRLDTPGKTSKAAFDWLVRLFSEDVHARAQQAAIDNLAVLPQDRLLNAAQRVNHYFLHHATWVDYNRRLYSGQDINNAMDKLTGNPRDGNARAQLEGLCAAAVVDARVPPTRLQTWAAPPP